MTLKSLCISAPSVRMVKMIHSLQNWCSLCGELCHCFGRWTAFCSKPCCAARFERDRQASQSSWRSATSRRATSREGTSDQETLCQRTCTIMLSGQWTPRLVKVSPPRFLSQTRSSLWRWLSGQASSSLAKASANLTTCVCPLTIMRLGSTSRYTRYAATKRKAPRKPKAHLSPSCQQGRQLMTCLKKWRLQQRMGTKASRPRTRSTLQT
mmetsp:Transcript_65428/g.114044  ORF Transcript_65428/g.114044 Transcript_65428/m.114044 type:complete len:210 (-) Transcript_65428:3006-3635(-)